MTSIQPSADWCWTVSTWMPRWQSKIVVDGPINTNDGENDGGRRTKTQDRHWYRILITVVRIPIVQRCCCSLETLHVPAVRLCSFMASYLVLRHPKLNHARLHRPPIRKEPSSSCVCTPTTFDNVRWHIKFSVRTSMVHIYRWVIYAALSGMEHSTI